MNAQAEVKRLKKQVDRLTFDKAKRTEEEMEKEIVKEASKNLKAIIPEEFTMLDRHNQIRGRAMYAIGGVPAIQKTDVLELLLEESSFAKISFLRGTMEKYLNWKHFGDHDTLFYWSTELFSDGKWRIIGTTKPAKYTGHSMKKPWGTLEYLTEPMSREKIDEMLTNKWEVTKARAAIIVSATFLGPVELKDYLIVQRSRGWSSNIEPDEEA